MPESLINTKRRINTIKSTEKITKAMKLVASVKYQRWKKYYDDNQPYQKGLKDTLIKAINGVGFSVLQKSEAMKVYNTDKTLYVVVTSSLGLCGSYNYSLFKTLDPLLKPDDELLFIGSKGTIHYKDKGYETDEEYVDMMDTYSYSKVKRLRHLLLQKYRTGKYSSVVLVYTHYKNSMTFIPTTEQILPLNVDSLGIDITKDDPYYPPIYEPDSETVLDNLIPHYIGSIIYNRLIEAQLSELASRRNAMEAATDSADKIVKQLTIVYNKSRQNAITQEITEVVGGANAGKENKDK